MLDEKKYEELLADSKDNATETYAVSFADFRHLVEEGQLYKAELEGSAL